MAHVAPLTFGELLAQFSVFETTRATGANRIIENSTWQTKLKGIRQLERSFTWLNPKDNALYEFEPLSEYSIRELTPEDVKHWLQAFGHRKEIISEGKSPAKSRYLNNLLSTIRQALEYGRLRRYWKDHPLLDYRGQLIQASKEERNSTLNNSLFKPLSLLHRDRILEWLKDDYQKCPTTHYNGREKLRRFFLYHYCVLGFNTGLRSPSELTALDWSHIDYKHRDIRVQQSREASGRIDQQIIRPYTKTIRHRSVPINNMSLESLRALEQYRQREQSWLFWNPRSGPKNPLALANGWAPLTGEKRIRYTFDKCLSALKIPSGKNQGQYRMRHTFVTLTLDHTNFSDAKVAALIGDNVETMRRHYQGFCKNRWKNEDDISQMDAMNSVGKGRLKAIK